MGRVALAVSVALALLFTVAGPSSAFQCPKLIKQVNDEAGNRLDDAGFSARQLAEDAEALHKAGKHAEAEAKAKEAMKQLGFRDWVHGGPRRPPIQTRRGSRALIEPRSTMSASESISVGSALRITTPAPASFATGTTPAIG